MPTNFTEKQKRHIVFSILGKNGYTKLTKAHLARVYGVSPRTIGRIYNANYRMEASPTTTTLAPEAPEPKPEEVEVPVEEVEYKFVATNHMISIEKINDRGSVTEMITKEDSRYDEVFKLVLEYHTTGDKEVIDHAFRLICIPEAIKHYSKGRITADRESNTLSYVNELGNTSYLAGKLVARVMAALDENNAENLEHLIAFSERLIDNPLYDAVQRLYDFIEHADIEITSEGKLICYKKVKNNFTDVRTGKFDNSPGKHVSEPRNEVNPDNKVTCGKGLHVCAKHYLGHYPGEIVIRCLVDPADVVAIPYDYNNSKMRTCGYYVLDQLT